MLPSPRQLSASTPRQTLARLVVLLVGVLLVAALVALVVHQRLDVASAPPSRGRVSSAATEVATSTPTPSVPFAFLDQALKTSTNLRGYYAFTETDALADGTTLTVIVELPTPPTLADAQWDAFVIQQLAWTTPDVQPHTGWEIAVSFHVLDGNAGWGTHVGMADLTAATAAQLTWAQFTPEQAWQRYDGTLFDPRGLQP
jgi:hypothetical protein